MPTMYKRIMIIGRGGSGKTVFADKLGKALGRSVTHLDKLFWMPGWVQAYTSQEWGRVIQELADQDEWILDGNYSRSIDIRFARADTVVFFNFSPFRSLSYAYKRKFFPPTVQVDKAENMPEKVSWAFIKMTFAYPTKRILTLCKNATGKRVYIVRSREEGERALQDILTKAKAI